MGQVTSDGGVFVVFIVPVSGSGRQSAGRQSSAMLRRSVRLLGLFENQFNKPGPMRISNKRRGIAWTWAVFSCPTFLVLVGNHPDVQEWFIKRRTRSHSVGLASI
eukprot:TRINITY_DN16991_c0_g3_i2.p3 TRINITY_DN16991_c0_g3~~TRINITY_DN16991_c0_g3_i2.p3  ORF type:complete len:105 (-),score=10.20 TRINITY_DN16991_c0_g3_i2:263-577(-)